MHTVIKLPKDTKIEFLVGLKFPALGNRQGSSSSRRKVRTLENILAEQYVASLKKLPDTELDTRYQTAVDGILAEADRREAARPFNQPNARADVSRWAKMAYWTPDEAVALSLGRDPKFANWETLQQLVQASRFAYRYTAQREIVMRAKTTGQLREKTAPSDFLEWAERMQFPVPDNLIEAVKALGPSTVDWKKLFEQSQSKVEALTDQIEGLERDKSRAKTERLGTKERESLLKLVIGMAVGAYEFHPIHGRRSIAKVIAHDLASAGLPMDQDTARKYVAAGKELLPRDKTE
jgi:hypothetical protein